MVAQDSDASRLNEDELLGQQAAEAVFRHRINADYEERRSSAFARAAVSRLGDLLGEQGLVLDLIEGARQGAESLNVEAYHGVVEVIQNAEDQGASELRIGYDESGERRSLLIVHDGRPVEFRHLVAMSFAFLSTKRDDPTATGRFGVGLKTLSRIATELEIHCSPYHVQVEATGPRSVRPAKNVSGFFRRENDETLLRLTLAAEFDWPRFEAWFRSLGSDVLLFVNHIKTLRLFDLRRATPRSIAAYRVRRTSPSEVSLPVGNRELSSRRLIVRDADGIEWTRYTTSAHVPADKRRRHKATGPTTELAVAVRSDGASGRLFAGLPLRIEPGLPFAVNGQFDPDTARFTLLDNAWNHWLLNRVGDLIEGIVRYEAGAAPRASWRWIPLVSEAEVPGQHWLTSELSALVHSIQRSVARRLSLRTGDAMTRLVDLSYETEELSGILSISDLQRLRPSKHPLPLTARDDGRWRKVLEELGGATRVDVHSALDALDWDEVRSPNWYVELAARALDAGLKLNGRRCIVQSDGSLATVPTRESGLLFVLGASGSEAAVQLGLAIAVHRIYAGSSADAAIVRGWLETHGIFKQAASGRDALTVLALRNEPIALSDDQLLAVRDVLFGELGREERQALGARVGRAVLIDGYQFEAGSTKRRKASRRRMKVSPATAYLSAALDATGKRSWPTAAGLLPGLTWIDSRYREVISRRDDQRGARALFSALGAAASPRLVARNDAEYKYGVPAYQVVWGEFGRGWGNVAGQATHVFDDHHSPDLDLVLADLVGQPVRSRRQRAEALLLTIAEHWRNDYSDYAEVPAVYTNYGWTPVAAVPTSWLYRLMSAAWLSSRLDQARRPIELAVENSQSTEVFGADRALFGAEFGRVERKHYDALQAMGVTVEPVVSQVVEALKDLRSQDARGSADTVMRAAGLYDVIAEHCVAIDGDASPRTAVGDMTVRALRAAFGIGKARGRGLIVARGGWWTPQMVFRGRRIFGERRAFVPERRRTDRLWEVLGVREPTISDCLDVLDEMSVATPDERDTGVLIEIYRYLASLSVRNASERDRLARSPLWSGREWIRERPVLAVEDQLVAEVLADRESVWAAPVPLATLGGLPERLGVTVLDLGSFAPVGIDGAAIAAGSSIEEQFRNAVLRLQDRFARRDEHLFRQLEPGWRALQEATLAVTPDLGIEIRIAGRQPVTVPAKAHAYQSNGRLIFASTSIRAAGSEGGGGRAVASLFGRDQTVDRDKVALAWVAEWEAAGAGPTVVPLYLAGEPGEDELDPLQGLQEGLIAAKNWRSATPVLGGRGRHKDGDGHASPESEQQNSVAAQPLQQNLVPLRQLKQLKDLEVGEISMQGSTTVQPKRKASKPAGLADPPPAPGPGAQGKVGTGGSSLAVAYTDDQREALAVEVLRRVLETDKRTLRDLRKVVRLGADVMDNLGKYFEIKAAAGEMPDSIDLQYSQIERAVRERREDWFLVVVAGLEVGYETKLRFIADPLRHLTFVEKGSAHLAGVRTARAVEVTLPERAESLTAS